MTDAEQVLAALILDNAEGLPNRRFKGSVAFLREQTEHAYKLERYAGAFEAALEFLEEHALARVHRFEGVEDYVSVDAASTVAGATLLSIAGARANADGSAFSFFEKNEDPLYPVISTWKDVGSSWLHDYALSLAKSESGDAPSAVDSASWTGRYRVSDENRRKIAQIFVDIRAELDRLNLSNEERSNALAAVEAAEALSSAADPAWALIVRILQSPVLANLTALAALAVAIIKG